MVYVGSRNGNRLVTRLEQYISIILCSHIMNGEAKLERNILQRVDAVQGRCQNVAKYNDSGDFRFVRCCNSSSLCGLRYSSLSPRMSWFLRLQQSKSNEMKYWGAMRCEQMRQLYRIAASCEIFQKPNHHETPTSSITINLSLYGDGRLVKTHSNQYVLTFTELCLCHNVLVQPWITSTKRNIDTYKPNRGCAQTHYHDVTLHVRLRNASSTIPFSRVHRASTTPTYK